MKLTHRFAAALVGLALLPLIAPAAQAGTLAEFTFENFYLGQVVGGASTVASGMTATLDMANNGVEDFGSPNFNLSMTRFAGSGNHPTLTFTNTVPIVLSSIEFTHIHNHNPGFPTYPNYNVDLEVDTGSGFTVLATFLAAPGGYDAEAVAGLGVLMPGTYSLRWIPKVSPDTNTEFFGLDDIRLIGAPLGCDPCVSWKNHGAYVSCVSKAVDDAVEGGFVSESEVEGIVASAAASNVGKKGFQPEECP